jgi:hypothetical protein
MRPHETDASHPLYTSILNSRKISSTGKEVINCRNMQFGEPSEVHKYFGDDKEN